MSFLYPGFLFALGFIAVPIIVHLFNFRRYKKIYFPNVSFLKEINQQTKTRSQLKHLLILLCRILAITCLVFAFAQPFIPYEGSDVRSGSKEVSIYIDNSFSMDATYDNGTLFQEAVKRAEQIKEAYGPNDRFQIITSDLQPKHQHFYSRDEITPILDELKTGPSSSNLKEIYARQKAAWISKEKLTRDIYYLSDFQKPVSGLKIFKEDSSVRVFLNPIIPAKRSNVYIDSCWFITPARIATQPDQIMVRVKNSTGEDLDQLPLTLTINGVQRAIATVNVAAGSYADQPISYTINETGIQQAVVSLKDHPITFDDDYYFSYDIIKELKVLVVYSNEEPKTYRNLFLNDPLITVDQQSSTQLNYSSLQNYNLVILHSLDEISSGLGQEIEKFTGAGGNVLVFPGIKAKTETYNAMLNPLGIPGVSKIDTADTKVETISTSHPILRNVFNEKNMEKQNIDLPLVRARYPIIKGSASGEQVLLSLRNNESFLSRFNYKKGTLYLCSSSLDQSFTNFSRHGIFVPVVYQIALFSRSTGMISNTTGSNDPYIINLTAFEPDMVFKLVNPKIKFEVIPDTRLSGGEMLIYDHGQVREAGNYILANSDSALKGLSWNYSRKESGTEYETPDELKKQIEDLQLRNVELLTIGSDKIGNTLSQIEYGTRLWKYFIVAALLFFLIEVILVRLWK